MRHPLPALIPELLVADLRRSCVFWCDLIGFSIIYDRPDEHFVMLGLGQAAIMIEQQQTGVRQWVTAPLDRPLGRGINLQIQVPSVAPIIDRLAAVGCLLFMDTEEKWYRIEDAEHGQRQFVVQDPDGYLLRLFESIGRRPTATGRDFA